MVSKTFVFVYGTLKRGFGNHPVIRDGTHTRLIGRASIPGRMISCGFFPGLLEPETDTDEVFGELYAIKDASVWSGLDRLEGYREDDPENSMYIRKVVVLNQQELLEPGSKVYTYYWNRDVGNRPIIESGEWKGDQLRWPNQ